LKIVLNEFQLTFHDCKAEKVIPYLAITDVRLLRKNDRFFAEINSLDFGFIRICCLQGSGKETTYCRFIQKLHEQLIRNKCETSFSIGFRTKDSMKNFLYFSLGAVFISFIEDYYDFLPFSRISVMLFLAVIGLLVVGIILAMNRGKAYHPSKIPLHVLPPIT
jgi:hypothetical protein